MTMKVKKGDTVKVIAGKDKGKTGIVLKAVPENSKVVVEGVNVRKKHRKARSQTEPGEIIEINHPIHISNTMVVSPTTKEASKVGYRFDSKGNKERYLKKTGEKLS